MTVLELGSRGHPVVKVRIGALSPSRTVWVSLSERWGSRPAFGAVSPHSEDLGPAWGSRPPRGLTSAPARGHRSRVLASRQMTGKLGAGALTLGCPGVPVCRDSRPEPDHRHLPPRHHPVSQWPLPAHPVQLPLRVQRRLLPGRAGRVQR